MDESPGEVGEGERPGPARREAAAVLQQQLVDLLALAVEATQARWTLRGPSTLLVAPRLRSLAATSQHFAESMAEHMVHLALTPNGTVPAQLVAIVPSRIPGWWPAPEAALEAATDAALISAATEERVHRLRVLAPASGRFLAPQVRVFDRHAQLLRSF